MYFPEQAEAPSSDSEDSFIVLEKFLDFAAILHNESKKNLLLICSICLSLIHFFSS